MKANTTTDDMKLQSLDLLFEYFKNYYPLAKAEKDEILAHFKERTVKRHSLILKRGDVCKHFTFVVSGCFRIYAADSNGKEHNILYAAEKNWIADLESFNSETPSEVFIEAIEPSVILQISHNDLLELNINYNNFARNFRIINDKIISSYKDGYYKV